MPQLGLAPLGLAQGLTLVLALVLVLVQPAAGWVTVSPQGRVTIKAETQIGHWELPEEVDARKSLFVTGDVNVGRDPSNVNVWGNVTLTGIVDLTAGADPDEALLRQGSVVELAGVDFVNGTLLNASNVGVTELRPAAAPGATVHAGALSARASSVDGPGTIMAISGPESDLAAGNIVFIYARDRFGNGREAGTDVFAMDPLTDASLHGRQEHVGSGKYALTFWWVTPLPKVAYEVCPTAEAAAVTRAGACKGRAHPLEDDRTIDLLQIYVHQPEPRAQTDAHACTATCLAGTRGVSSCGSERAVSGVEASFTIEAKSEGGAAQYDGGDAFTVALDGPERVSARVQYLRLNHYEVKYTATLSGDYDLAISLTGRSGSQPLPKVPTQVRVFAAPADVAHSSVAVSDDELLSVDSPVTVTLHCRDSFDNPTDTLAAASIRHQGSAEASSTRKVECVDGVGRVSLRSPLSGKHFVSVLVQADDDQMAEVHNSPATVSLKPGSLDIGSTAWVDAGEPVVAAPKHEVLFQAADSLGNAVAAPDLQIGLQLAFRDGSADSSRPAPTHAAAYVGAGIYRAVVQLDRVGRYLASYTVSDTEGRAVTVGPLDLKVVSGTVHMPSCHIEVGDLRGSVAGEAVAFRAELRDALGNLRTSQDTVEFLLLDRSGEARSSVTGTTSATDWSVPVVAGGSLDGEHRPRATGIYTPLVRVNGELEYRAPAITVTFGPPGAARVFGWRRLDGRSVLVGAGVPEYFSVQSLDQFGNERTTNDVDVHVDISSGEGEPAPREAATSYSEAGAGLYRVAVQVPNAGTFNMAVSTSSKSAPSSPVPARLDEVNTAHGVRLVAQPSSTARAQAPLWLVRPRWHLDAGSDVHPRRLQDGGVEIDYAIELELQESDLDSLLADDNANASSLEGNMAAALDARLAAAAELMTGGDFAAELAESVNEAAEEMVAGCTRYANEQECETAEVGSGCRFAAYQVITVQADGDDPGYIQLAQASDLITEGTTFRIQTQDADGTDLTAESPWCEAEVAETDGAVVSAVDDRLVTFRAASTPTCDLDAGTDDSAECPDGCDDTPASTPTCDLDASTDDSAECPAGCDADAAADPPTCTGEADEVPATCTGTADPIPPALTVRTEGAETIAAQNCMFTTCVPNVTMLAPIEADDIVNEAPNMTELMASVVVQEAVFDGSASLQGSLQGVSCGVPAAFVATVFDSYGNVQTQGNDEFVFEWVAKCTTTSQIGADIDACAAVPLAGDDGGQNACELTQTPQSGGYCMFSRGTADQPDITFNATTSEYAMSFEVVTCGVGAVHFTLTVNGVNVTKAEGTDALQPRTVACTPGAIDAQYTEITARSRAAEITARAEMMTGQRESLEFRARDLYNNIKLAGGDGARIAFDITVPEHGNTPEEVVRCAPQASVECSLADFNDGRYQAEYQARYVGVYTANIVILPVGADPSAAGESIQRSPLQANVVVGPLVPSRCTLAVSATELEVGTTGGTLQVSLYDAYDNPIDSVPVGYRSPCTDDFTSTCKYFYLLIGETQGADPDASTPLQLPYASTASGPMTVTVFYKGEDGGVLPVGRPGTQEVAVEFSPGPAVLANSLIVSGEGRTNDCIASALSEFVIQTRDEFGNNCDENAPGAWSISLEECEGATEEPTPAQCAAGQSRAGQVTAAGDGQYAAVYQAFNTGYFKVSLTYDGGHVEFDGVQSPFVILSDTMAVPQQCVMLPRDGENGLLNTRAGDVAVFTLQANGEDEAGLPIPRRGSGEQFEVTVEGGGGAVLEGTPTQEYQGLGVYRMSYVANSPDHDVAQWTFTVNVQLQGSHINGSPFEGVIMRPADTAAAYTAATGQALMQGTAGVTEVFEISARDEYNNFVTGCVDDLTSFAGQLTLDGEPAADVVVRGCTEGLPSTYEVEYVLTAAAVYSLALGYGGQALDGTPHEVTIGSSTVSAQDTYLAVTGQWGDPAQEELAPAAPAAADAFATLAAGELYTFYVHGHDRFGNRLTQNMCAEDTGEEDVMCLNFAFRWCGLHGGTPGPTPGPTRTLNTIDATACHTEEVQAGVTIARETTDGPGVYQVSTSTLTRAGGYRVDVTVQEADGTTVALSNSHIVLGVNPAAPSAQQSVMAPALTVMAAQTVTFEVAARDEFQNAVELSDLVWTFNFGCTTPSPTEMCGPMEWEHGAVRQNSAPIETDQCCVDSHVTYLGAAMNLYQVSYTVDSGGSGARLEMEVLLGGVLAATHSIVVRAAQNAPILCYVISPEAGQPAERANAELGAAALGPDGQTVDVAYSGADVLNEGTQGVPRKVAGDTLTVVIQSILASGQDRSFPEPAGSGGVVGGNICTPAQIASEDDSCDRLDEFELVAIHQGDQTELGPFREECESLCDSPGPDDTCPNYANSACVTHGEYQIGWTTELAGDWELSIRSLGVMIQTAVDESEAGVFLEEATGGKPRFLRANLLETGYLVDPTGDGLSLYNYKTHVYPAPMDAARSTFTLETPCEAETPCLTMGSPSTLTVIGRDRFGNQLEEHSSDDPEAPRLRATIETQCLAAHANCAADSGDFAYADDSAGSYPGHFQSSIVPKSAGPAKVTVFFDDAPVGSGAMPSVVAFPVGAPTPNSGYIQAGSDMSVQAAIYGFLDLTPSFVPSFSCEWFGGEVGDVYSTDATLLPPDEARPNMMTLMLGILGGGAHVSWSLEQNGADGWQTVLGGGGGLSYPGAGPYGDDSVGNSPCIESVEVLRTVAEGVLADDPRQAAVVDWTAEGATCADALGVLGKYGLTCESAYSAVEGQQSVSAADACPVACNRCASAGDSVLEVKAALAGGDYRLTPALPAVDLSDMPEGSTAPALWIYAVDGAGIVLVPNTTYTATPAQPLPFSLIAPRTLSCDGAAPTVHAEGQSAFEVKVKYTTTDDAVFTDPCAETPDGVTCTQSAFDNDRYFASSTSAPFYFYDNPVVNENAVPAYGGDVVYVPATDAGDDHVGTLLSLVGTGLDNGNGADKTQYQCRFSRINDTLSTFTTDARYISSEQVECLTPDFAGLEPGQYAILVSMNSQHFSTTDKVVKTFAALSIAPTFAAVQGQVEVEVEIFNGFAADVGAVFCRFGDWTWPLGTADNEAPLAGPNEQRTNAVNGQPTNALQVPLADSVGDVVSATLVATPGREVWRCPLPNIQDTRDFKPRNEETPVRLSYDGSAWSNRVDFFYYDQPDLPDPQPPIGPTNGGTLITLTLSPGPRTGPDDTRGRDYHLRADSYVAKCLWVDPVGYIVSWIDPDGRQQEGLNNATVQRGAANAVTLQCNSPPNEQPGSKYDLDVSLDGGLTWAYDDDTSEGRAIPNPPEFSYYTTTNVITEDAADNYNSARDFRGPINVATNQVDVRFQYSCGYTTEFTELVRCKFGDAEPSMATLESTNVGADGRVNRLTCNVPLNNVTATVPIAVSLNGVDFTALTSDTTYVYFGQAVALRAWWQADASSAEDKTGTAGMIAGGVIQRLSDAPPTLSADASLYMDLDVVKVEIIDDQGSFVSEDDRASARVKLTLAQILGGGAREYQPLRLTVRTLSDGSNDDHEAGATFDVVNGEYVPELWMGMNTDIIMNAPGLPATEPHVAPAPGTTMFVGLQLDAPVNGDYEVVLSMDQEGCTGSTTQGGLNPCSYTGCCLSDPATTWEDAIVAGEMRSIPDFRLGLTIAVGDTSVIDTAVKNDETLMLDITPIQQFELVVQAKDSAQNVRPQSGDRFQMRLIIEEGEVACGAYVRPEATVALGAPRVTTSPDEASAWCGPAACEGIKTRTSPTAPSQPAVCALGPGGGSRAKRIVEWDIINPASQTQEVMRTDLVCADESGSPLCQQYDEYEEGQVPMRDGSMEDVTGFGGAEQPGVFEGEAAMVLGEYKLSSGLIELADVDLGAAREPRYKKLRVYGRYRIVIEGSDPSANASDPNVNRIGTDRWVEIGQSPQYGVIRPVDCRAKYNDEEETNSPLTGSLAAYVQKTGGELQGSRAGAEGKQCRCLPGYERDLDFPDELNGLLPGQVVCRPCDKGSYKSAESNTVTCSACPPTTTTQAGRCYEKEVGASGDLHGSDAQRCAAVTDNVPRASGVNYEQMCVGDASRGIKGVPTSATMGQENSSYWENACVYEPSQCEAGGCTSKDVCQCQDDFYDFRNVYLSCIEEQWYNLADPKSSRMAGDSTGPGLVRLHVNGIQCAECPSCVNCYENGTISLKKGYWTFAEELKTSGKYYWDYWEHGPEPYGPNDASCSGDKAGGDCIYTADKDLPNPLYDEAVIAACDDGDDSPECTATPTIPNVRYKHWMITAYKCLHSPGGLVPTCMGGDWELAQRKSGDYTENSKEAGSWLPHRNCDALNNQQRRTCLQSLSLGIGQPPYCDGCDRRPASTPNEADAALSNGFCKVGSAGLTCATCAVGYKREKGGAGCKNCEEDAVEAEEKDTDWGKLFLMFVTSIIVIALAVFAMKRAKVEDILKIKILVAFGQVIQSFASTYKVSWPPTMRQFIDQFSIVSFDLFTVGNIECFEAMRWVKTFFAQFTFMVLMPWAVTGLLLVGYLVNTWRAKQVRAAAGKMSLLEQKIEHIEITGAWAGRWFLFLIVVYLKVSKTVLEMFQCRKFEPFPVLWEERGARLDELGQHAGPLYQKDEDEWWMSDHAKERLGLVDDSLFGDGREASDFSDRKGLEKDMRHYCTESTYSFFYFFAWINVGIYPCGVPGFFILLMWREREQISDSINQKKYGFLFADYVQMYFLWEVIDLFRKLLLSGLMIFFQPGSVGQLLAGMIIALIFLELQLRLMPYNDLLANAVQTVAFNAIFLNLLGAVLTKVKMTDGVDSNTTSVFINYFLIFVNVSVPVVVLFMLAFSVGYDMYLISIGKMVKGGLAGKSRAMLLEAIGQRKDNRAANVRKKSNIAEEGLKGLYHALWKREDVDEALLSEELAYLDKRRDERDKAIILFRQAQVHHEEKREWYRFVYNHTKTEEEFNEIVQTESLASYKRLMLGLDDEMEDDIHERVTREIVVASNQMSGSDQDDDFANPVFADEEAPAPKKKKKAAQKSADAEDPTAAPPKKEKKKKKKKKAAEDEDGWFGEEDEPKKKKKDKKKKEPEPEPKKKKKAEPEPKKGKKSGKGKQGGVDPTSEFPTDFDDAEDPTAMDVEEPSKKKKGKKGKKGK